MKTLFSIGRLAALTDCKPVTIRYFEAAGLMPEPERTAAGHRLYGDDHVRRVTFIRRARRLGFSQDDVRHMLDLIDRDDAPCRTADHIAEARLNEVRRKIEDLKSLETMLEAMLSRCGRDRAGDCEVLGALRSISAPMVNRPAS